MKAQNDFLLHLNWFAHTCAREPPLSGGEIVSVIVLGVLGFLVLLKSIPLRA